MMEIELNRSPPVNKHAINFLLEDSSATDMTDDFSETSSYHSMISEDEQSEQEGPDYRPQRRSSGLHSVQSHLQHWALFGGAPQVKSSISKKHHTSRPSAPSSKRNRNSSISSTDEAPRHGAWLSDDLKNKFLEPSRSSEQLGDTMLSKSASTPTSQEMAMYLAQDASAPSAGIRTHSISHDYQLQQQQLPSMSQLMPSQPSPIFSMPIFNGPPSTYSTPYQSTFSSPQSSQYSTPRGAQWTENTNNSNPFSTPHTSNLFLPQLAPTERSTIVTPPKSSEGSSSSFYIKDRNSVRISNGTYSKAAKILGKDAPDSMGMGISGSPHDSFYPMDKVSGGSYHKAAQLLGTLPPFPISSSQMMEQRPSILPTHSQSAPHGVHDGDQNFSYQQFYQTPDSHEVSDSSTIVDSHLPASRILPPPRIISNIHLTLTAPPTELATVEEYVEHYVGQIRAQTYCTVLPIADGLKKEDTKINCPFGGGCTKKIKGKGNLRRHMEWHLRKIEEEIRRKFLAIMSGFAASEPQGTQGWLSRKLGRPVVLPSR